MKRLNFFYLFIFLISGIMAISSCSKDNTSSNDYHNILNLHADTGGVHTPFILGSTDAPYGYYVYTPSYYHELSEVVFPLLVFLHGSGEKGNSQDDPDVLSKVISNGPPKMIKKGEWDPKYPMIVVSPQCHDGSWNVDKIKEFVEYMISNYKVNVRRIYVTGLSMGGYGTFSYIGKYADASYAAAVVPICGGGNVNQAENFKTIPLWAFHGEADATVLPQKSIDMVNAINNASPQYQAKLTMFPDIGHNSWDYTYTSSGMGKESAEYDPFNKSIYNWMFMYERRDIDSLESFFR